MTITLTDEQRELWLKIKDLPYPTRSPGMAHLSEEEWATAVLGIMRVQPRTRHCVLAEQERRRSRC